MRSTSPYPLRRSRINPNPWICSRQPLFPTLPLPPGGHWLTRLTYPAGQTVLIHGAAGGVGTNAVQLAKLRGARVIGTASTSNQDYLRSLGVDETIDYKTTRFEDVVHDVDIVLDLVGDIGDGTQQRSWQVLKPGGNSGFFSAVPLA